MKVNSRYVIALLSLFGCAPKANTLPSLTPIAATTANATMRGAAVVSEPTAALPTFEQCLPHADVTPGDSSIDTRLLLPAQVTRLRYEQACFDGDLKSCWTVVEELDSVDPVDNPNPTTTGDSCAEVLSQKLCEVAPRDLAGLACFRLGIEQLGRRAPRTAANSVARACELGNGGACAMQLALTTSANAESAVDGYCTAHSSECEQAAVAMQRHLGEACPQPAQQRLLRAAAHHGRLLALTLMQRSTDDELELFKVLKDPCQKDLPQCRLVLESRLEEQQALAIRLALCSSGMGSACRWASVQMATNTSSSASKGRWRMEALNRGCTLNDTPTCALLGATIALSAEQGSPEAKQAETLLKQACRDKRFACHQLTAPDERPNERLGAERISTDPRFKLLLGAACAVGQDEISCRQLEQLEGNTEVALPWSAREIAQGKCQGGVVAACMGLLMHHQDVKVPSAACRANVAGACEALSMWGNNERSQLAFARKACGLGRCGVCSVISNAPDLKPFLKDLQSGCSSGCKDVCAHLSTVYIQGSQGVPENMEQARRLDDLARQ